MSSAPPRRATPVPPRSTEDEKKLRAILAEERITLLLGYKGHEGQQGHAAHDRVGRGHRRRHLPPDRGARPPFRRLYGRCDAGCGPVPEWSMGREARSKYGEPSAPRHGGRHDDGRLGAVVLPRSRCADHVSGHRMGIADRRTQRADRAPRPVVLGGGNARRPDRRRREDTRLRHVRRLLQLVVSEKPFVGARPVCQQLSGLGGARGGQARKSPAAGRVRPARTGSDELHDLSRRHGVDVVVHRPALSRSRKQQALPPAANICHAVT